MKILALLGAIQGIILFLYVLPSKRNKKANVNFLIGMSLSVIQILLVCFVQNPYSSDGHIYLKMITWVLPFIIPVLLFFYFRFLLEERQSYVKTDLWFFIPAILATLAITPYFLIRPFSSSWEDIDPHFFAQQGLLHAFFYSAVIIVFGKRMYMLYYDYKSKILDLYSGFELNQLTWIKGNAFGVTIIGVTGFVVAILGIIKVSKPDPDLYTILTPDYFMFLPISLLFYWYSYKVIQAPELFRYVDSGEQGKVAKYSNSGLRVTEGEAIATKLLELMITERLYLDPNLKLSDVANCLETSKQIVSQVINQHFNQNFFDFVNAYRIRIAKENLLDPEYSHLTIEGVASEAGFKSKSTFYEFFKKQTGLTPRQFQKKGPSSLNK